MIWLQCTGVSQVSMRRSGASARSFDWEGKEFRYQKLHTPNMKFSSVFGHFLKMIKSNKHKRLDNDFRLGVMTEKLRQRVLMRLIKGSRGLMPGQTYRVVQKEFLL